MFSIEFRKSKPLERSYFDTSENTLTTRFDADCFGRFASKRREVRCSKIGNQ